MSDLVVISFSTEAEAQNVRKKLFEMQRDYLIDIGDAVVATKDQDGKIHLDQMFSTTAAGAASGSFWGLLVGVLFMMPLVGAAVGATAGALTGVMMDFGINDRFMKELSASLPAGGAALFVLVNKMTADKVLAGLQGVGGRVMRTSLDRTKEQALRDALAAHAAATAGAPDVIVPPAPVKTASPSAGAAQA